MVPMHKILMPTDFSPVALSALPYVRELARSQKSAILLAHVARSEREVESATSRLEAVQKQLEPLPSEIVVRVGRATERLLEIAAEKDVDLIVMSTHGRSRVPRWPLGRVTEKIVRGAECPVLSVKHAKHRMLIPHDETTAESSPVPVVNLRRSDLTREDVYFAELDRKLIDAAQKAKAGVAADHDISIKTILAPTDFSAAAEQGVKFAAQVASANGASIVLLYVAPLLPTGMGAFDVSATALPDVLTGQLPALREQFAEIQSKLGVPCETKIAFGEPVRTIVALASEIDTDLIVMATRGSSGLARFLLGNTTEGVVNRSTRPVLTIRAKS